MEIRWRILYESKFSSGCRTGPVEQAFFEANNVTKKQMREYLSDHVLEEGFRGLERGDGWQTKRPAAMDSSRVTLQCHDLVPALLPLLRRIVDDPESGWCQYILDTTLQLLFPQGEELHESRRIRLAKNIILQTIRTVINQSGHAVSDQSGHAAQQQPTHAVSGQLDHVPDQSGHASPNLQISFQPHLPSYAILGQDEIIQFLDRRRWSVATADWNMTGWSVLAAELH